MAVPKDTSPDAWARHLEALRALSPQERLELAVAMSDDVREIARDGVRHRHPAWSTVEVEAALEEAMLGPTLAGIVRARRPASRT